MLGVRLCKTSQLMKNCLYLFMRTKFYLSKRSNVKLTYRMSAKKTRSKSTAPNLSYLIGRHSTTLRPQINRYLIKKNLSWSGKKQTSDLNLCKCAHSTKKFNKLSNSIKPCSLKTTVPTLLLTTKNCAQMLLSKLIRHKIYRNLERKPKVETSVLVILAALVPAKANKSSLL